MEHFHHSNTSKVSLSILVVPLCTPSLWAVPSPLPHTCFKCIQNPPHPPPLPPSVPYNRTVPLRTAVATPASPLPHRTTHRNLVGKSQVIMESLPGIANFLPPIHQSTTDHGFSADCGAPQLLHPPILSNRLPSLVLTPRPFFKPFPLPCDIHHPPLTPSNPHSQQVSLPQSPPYSSCSHSSYSQDLRSIPRTHSLSSSEIPSPTNMASVTEPVTPVRCTRPPLLSLSASTLINKKVKCSHCGQCFEDKHSRRVHVAKAHPKRFACATCPRTFTRRCDLEKHGLIVHEKMRPWTCGLCPQRFGQRHHMERHVRAIHHRQRPFECGLCLLRFSRKEHLVNHERAVHGMGKLTTCPLCDFRCMEKGGLAVHLEQEHSVKSCRVGSLADWQPSVRGRPRGRKTMKTSTEQ